MGPGSGEKSSSEIMELVGATRVSLVCSHSAEKRPGGSELELWER